jgi:hypothetical protein
MESLAKRRQGALFSQEESQIVVEIFSVARGRRDD